MTISEIFNRRAPKTMALGGVATGNIKAKDPATVAGTIKNKGLMRKATAMEAKTGKKVSTVAVLEVNSVKKVMVVTTNKSNKIGGKCRKPDKDWPM